MSTAKLLDPLDGLVAALPELYQPLFDHPERSRQVSRTCEDRLAQITLAYRALEALLGRPLRAPRDQPGPEVP